MSDIIDLKNSLAVANHPALTALQNDLDYLTRPSEGLRAGFLHNVLYAVNLGPLLPTDDDSHYITFANKRQASFVYILTLSQNQFLAEDGLSGGLSERGKTMLGYLDRTRGPCEWQIDDAVLARRAAFHLV